ncbi:MAG: hypothetical protein GY780_02940 [bacterium]|nr:hypothetical protein [bacterium]
MPRVTLILAFVITILPHLSFAEDAEIIQLIMEQKQEQVIEKLKANPELLETKNESFNSSLLHIAAQAKSNRVLEYLFTTDLDLETINWDNHTAMHWAAYVENLEGIDLLVSAGANLEAKTYKGETPLRIAVQYGKTAAVKSLINAGADCETKAKNDVTLMHAVATGGNAETTELLLNKGLDIDIRNLFGKTPLHYAAQSDNVDVLEILVKRGAKLEAIDVSGRNPLDYALKDDNEKAKDVLEKSGLKATGTQFPTLKGPYLGQTPPGKSPKMFAPGLVSTEGWEFAPTFISGGNEILFTRRGGEDGLRRNTILTTDSYSGIWSRPENTHFSGEYFDYEPFVINQGARLIFGSRRPSSSDDQSGDVSYWVLDRQANAWTNLRQFGPPLAGRHAMFPTMADNGNLYFSSNPDQEGSDSDLFVSTFNNGTYNEPRTLGKNLDRLIPKMHPFIAPDESYVLFDAQPQAPENYDSFIYVSFHDEDGSWTEPRRINLEHPEIRTHGIASVTPDGKYMFFSSGGNIFWVDAAIIQQYR